MWSGICFSGVIKGVDDSDLEEQLRRQKQGKTDKQNVVIQASIEAPQPVFSMTFPQPDADDFGLADNPCRDDELTKDLGFTLLSWDPFYGSANNPQKPPYDYSADYQPKTNGDSNGPDLQTLAKKYPNAKTQDNANAPSNVNGDDSDDESDSSTKRDLEFILEVRNSTTAEVVAPLPPRFVVVDLPK